MSCPFSITYNKDKDKYLLRHILKHTHKHIIYSNWVMFGSDGLIKHPEDIRTAIVHRKKDLNSETKWIIRPKYVKSKYLSLHIIKKNAKINDKYVLVDNSVFHLNHYPIQSREFFEKVKKTRGDAQNIATDNIRDDNYFALYDKDTNVLDEPRKKVSNSC